MVRFGIVGFGLHGVKRLLPAFRASSRAKLAAISRSSAERARAAAQEHGIPLAFGSAEELCASGKVDAVLVASPNARHLADVLCAVEHGKPALCEKPLAINAEEGRRMVAAARDAGVALGVAQVFRFAAVVQRFRERVQGGDIGRPVAARSEFHFPGRGHARQWMTDAAVAGGGPVADVGVHCIDLLRWVLGAEVAKVAATGARDRDSGTVEAAASVALGFENGCVGAVEVSFRSEYHTSLEIAGEEGRLRADNALLLTAPVAIELARGGAVTEREERSNASAFRDMLEAFADAVEGKAAFPVPGEEGVKNQAVIDAAYRSMARDGLVERGF